MLYHNVRVMAHLLVLVDTSAIAAGAVVAWGFGIGTGFLSFHDTASGAWVFCFALFALFPLIAARLHVYQARRTEDIHVEIIQLCEATLYASSLACLVTITLAERFSNQAMMLMAIAGTLSLLCLRLLMRLVVRHHRRHGEDYRVWLIVGDNARSQEIVETIQANPHFGIRIEAVVDFADEPDTRHPTPPSKSDSLSAGGIERIRDIVATRVIDEIVITLPIRSYYDKISDIIDLCSEAGISVKLRPEAFTTNGFSTEVGQVGHIPMVTHYSGPSNYGQLALKRVLDIIGAAFGLIVLFPVLVIIAFLVGTTSPGPIFFRQWRAGLHGRHFRMVKFRSMTQDASEKQAEMRQLNERDGTAFKVREDPRITPVGRFLRKYHLDELPQLWNVLIGDMSLVGPRPLPLAEANGNEWWQRRRLSMPPGITCFWQLRDDPSIPFHDWMRLDIDYIDQWSVWLDIKILFRTFSTVVRGGGW